MSENSKNWIVKDAEGRLRGPFSTQKVLKQIERGDYVGNEMIALYPGGQWISISKTPEFYDKLLDALALEGATPPQAIDFDKTDPIIEEEDSSTEKSEDFNTEASVPHFKIEKPLTLDVPNDEPKVVDLSDLSKPKIPAKKKSSKKRQKADLKEYLLPAALGLVGLLMMMSYFGSHNKSGDRIHLLAPRLKQSAMTAEKADEKFKRAVASFEKDTFDDYLHAQNDLVEVLEGSPNNKQALSTLCLVYRELWPFAYQDSKDLKAITTVDQQGKKIDPGGLDGAICEIVSDQVNSKDREAQTLTESWLQDQAGAAVLYEIRGEMFANANDHATAASYFEKVRSLWPQWLKPYIYEGRSRVATNQPAPAIELFRSVISRNPDHNVAKIEAASLEYEQYGYSDKAFTLVSSAVNSSNRVDPETGSRGELLMARIYLQRNERSKALDWAKKSYAMNPGNGAAREMVIQLGGKDIPQSGGSRGRMVVGDQYFKTGDYIAAQAEFRAAFEEDPKNAMAAMRAAQCLWQLNQSNDAIQMLQKALSADPQLITAYVLLADYYSQRFDFYAAGKVLERAQRVSPKNPEVFRGYAAVELRRNNFKGAEGYAQKALQLYATDSATYIIMAKAKLGLLQFTEAQGFVNRAVELDVNNVEAQSLNVQVIHMNKGIDAAIAHANDLIGAYPYVAEYRLALAEALAQEERYPAAEAAYKQVLAIDKTNKVAVLGLGKVLQAQGRAREALEVYLNAAILDPSDANPVFMMGQLHLSNGKNTEAIAQFQRVLKINPRYPRAHLSLGRAQLNLNNPKAALEEANEERAINPELGEASVLAAEAQAAMRQYSQCAVEYQKALKYLAQDTMIYVAMARCYRRSGALDAALSLLRQASLRESGNAAIYKEMGAIYQLKSMADEAIEAYNKYLTLSPGAKDKALVEQMIQKVGSGDYQINDDF